MYVTEKNSFIHLSLILVFDLCACPKVVPPEFVMRMKLRYPVFYDMYVHYAPCPMISEYLMRLFAQK